MCLTCWRTTPWQVSHDHNGVIKSNESHSSVRVWRSFGSEVLLRVPGSCSRTRAGKANTLPTAEVTSLQTVRRPCRFVLQVLIRVHACGVNPVETYIRAGAYARKPSLPYTPGSDVAGVVKAVGDGVRFLKVSSPLSFWVFSPCSQCMRKTPDLICVRFLPTRQLFCYI